MPATTQRRPTIASPTAMPKAIPRMGADGYPVKVWLVDGEEQEFSLRPFTEEEREERTYWCPKGPGAHMWWRAQEKNAQGFQVIIQREDFTDGSYRPRNAWEEYMTVEWLKRLDGGAQAETWKGWDHPDERTRKPGDPHKHWICKECGWACGSWACFDQHQRSKRHDGITKN